MTMGAIGIALLAMTSCTDSETEIPVQPGGDGDQVALGVSPNLKVAAGTKATTKAVVDGDAITYAQADYASADYAPGLGVLVTNANATGWYTPDAGSTGHHVWYMGDHEGANWKSIQTKGANFGATQESPYFLTSTVGKVYAYYPYDANITASLTNIAQESDLAIPVTILANGTNKCNHQQCKKVLERMLMG